jgi:hypothetical protein
VGGKASEAALEGRDWYKDFERSTMALKIDPSLVSTPFMPRPTRFGRISDLGVWRVAQGGFLPSSTAFGPRKGRQRLLKPLLFLAGHRRVWLLRPPGVRQYSLPGDVSPFDHFLYSIILLLLKYSIFLSLLQA